MKNKKKINNINCCVYGCHTKKGREKHLSFHRFPPKKAGYVTSVNKFGIEDKICRRKAWEIGLIMKKPATSFMRVCSLHFQQDDFVLSGFATKLRRLKKNAVPSLNLPEESDVSGNSKPDHQRIHRQQRRNKRKEKVAARNSENENSNTVSEETAGCSFEEGSSNALQKPIMPQLVEKENEAVCGMLELVNARVDKATQVKSGDILIPFITVIDSETKLKSLTGLLSFNLLSVLTDLFIEHFPQTKSGKLTVKERIILTFMKMKTGLKYAVLATLFNVASSKICKIVFKNTISRLAVLLKPVIPFPDLEECQRNLPKCFKDISNIRVVLDYIELPLQKPKCLCCCVNTYSHYKGGHIVKFMTGVTPANLINFVSRAYGGRASDEAIFEQSGLVDKLDMGEEAVMVDREFCIDGITSSHFIKLIQPPFLRIKKQFSEQEAAKATVEIAKARVHIERLNQRIKVFEIFNKPLPVSLLPEIDDMFIVACAIFNLSPPVIDDDEML